MTMFVSGRRRLKPVFFPPGVFTGGVKYPRGKKLRPLNGQPYTIVKDAGTHM